MDLSVVIPVYRSAETLRALVERLVPVLQGAGLSYEIIFVEDGGPDNSWEILTELRRERPGQIIAIQLMRNFGAHNALMCGFRQARGAIVVTMDDDLQNPPEEIPKLLRALKEKNLDLVYGAPPAMAQAAWRNLGSALVHRFHRRIFRTSVYTSSFRAIRRPVVQSILPYVMNFTYIDGLLAWNTQRIGQIPVEHHPRASGRSGYSFGKLIVLALNLFTNFSLLPLQLASLFGIAVAICGFVAGFVYLMLALFSKTQVPGYASTIVAILVLGGTQLMALGVMGEYLGRLHLNVNRKPQYTIRQTLRDEDSQEQPPATVGAGDEIVETRHG